MLIRFRALCAPALLVMMWNCGSTSSADGTTTDAGGGADVGPSGTDAATGTDTGTIATDAATSDVNVQDTSVSETGSCTPGGVCASNPGAPCKAGKVSCTTGTAQCVDDGDAVDGTTCTTGRCAGGACLGTTSVSADTNLSLTPVAAGRQCADGGSWSVLGLTANTATLQITPLPQCLAVGDEVLLISLQGSSAGTANVGNWELLRVASSANSTITFTSNKTKSYGATAGSDTGVGIGATDQKVALYRVPSYGELTIASGKTLSADKWDGLKGGVVALRAGKLTVEGKISASNMGYRSGRWSQDNGDCDDNVATEAGESYTGPALVATANNGGAAGGLSALTDLSYNGDTPLCAGAGHATAGEAGKNPKGRTLGTAGAAYGVNNATKLTMGSGATSNLTCDVAGTAGGALITAHPTTAGGIVLLLTGELTVGASGSITATASNEGRDVSASGGYVYVKGTTLAVGTDKVTAQGATATSANISGSFIGQTTKSSDGYVVLDGNTVTGTTKPTFVNP